MNGEVSVWNWRTSMRLRHFDGDGPLHCVIYSPDGKLLAALGDYNYFKVWSAASGRPLESFGDSSVDNAFSMAFSQNSRCLAAAGCALGLWEVRTGSARWIRKTQQGNGYAQTFSADGRQLAWGANDGSIRIIDTQTLEEISRLTGHQKVARSLVFSPDGKSLVSLGLDGTLRLWELATRKERYRISGIRVMKHAYYNLCPQTISSNARVLAAADPDQVIHVWDVFSGRKLCRIHGHRDRVYALALSPDGEVLASAGKGKQILVWKLKTHLPARPERSPELSSGQLKQLWNDLQGQDAYKAFQAIRAFVSAAERSVPYLQKQLKRNPGPIDPRRIDSLIEDLDNDDYNLRKKATQELEQLGKSVLPPLERMLAKSRSLEARTRGLQLKNRLTNQVTLPPDVLRAMRAVEVLEQAGTPEAQAVLKELATQAALPELRLDAKAAYKRLMRRSNDDTG